MRRPSAALRLALPTLLLGASLSACSGGDDQQADAEAYAESLASALAAAAGPAEEPAEETPSASGSTSAGAPAETESETEAEPASPLLEAGFTGAEPDAVVAEFDAIVDDMDGIAPEVSVDDVAAVDDEGDSPTTTATLRWSWPVVADVDPWTYTTEVALTRTGEDWGAAWSPAVVADLEAGETLDARTASPDRGDITGAGGEIIVSERPVMRVGIDRTRVEDAQAGASARALAVAVGIDPAPYVAEVEAAGERAFVEAITYRADEVPAEVSAVLGSVPGAHGIADEVALAPSRTFAAPILGRVGPVTAEMVAEDPDAYRVGDIAGVSGLQARYDDQMRGTPGRVVRAIPADPAAESRVLFEHAAVAGQPLALTLDVDAQTLAEDVLPATGPAAALVAIRPSDGAIVAAANNESTGGQNLATFGQFAPGSTFKIVSSLALLRAGLTPASPVRCTPTVTVNGKQFKNYSDYPAGSLGTIALRDAVAQSCNTAFISQRGELGDGDLAAAAASLGLGIDHEVGFPAYFGQVPAPASETEAAADLIGQGTILASPMAMATVISSVQAGTTVVPRLVEGVTSPVSSQAEPLAKGEAGQLKAMLRRVVTDGSGRGLADVPGGPVIAKTGTAEYADGGTIRTHAWMVAAQGDLAVAVFVQTGESGSQTAGPVIEAFLRGMS